MEKKTKILIVEDERITALFFEKLLTASGYIVTGNVSSGEDAIQSVAQDPPSVVLMDIFINGTMDGIETAARIQEQCGAAIIFTSANADNIAKDRLAGIDKIDFVSKPISKNELLTKIKNFII